MTAATAYQLSVLRQLGDRGAQTAASIAAAASLSIDGASRALRALRDEGCVETQHGGYWHLTIAGVDTLRAQGVRA